MRHSCELVFEFAPEGAFFAFAFVRAGREFACGRGRGGGGVVFVVGVRADHVVFGWGAVVFVFFFYALALRAAEGREVLVVVVGVHPDAARGVFGRVDEELVSVLRVEGADPAWWEGAELVLHGFAGGDGNAIFLAARDS